MNARQAAEYRDSLARHNIARREETRDAIRAAEKARPKRPRKPRTQPPPVQAKSAPKATPRSPDEAALTARLLAHVCAESVIDREQHALGVARMIRNMGAA